jgi:cap1 methyltransferase
MHFITADGGFDFSEDFNKQEQKITNLLFAQIAYALCTQKKGGTFVLKMFDCFAAASIDLLYLLSSFYEKVYVTKPQTSRMANSERYIVCINFHFVHYSEFYPYILSAFTKMSCSEGRPVQRFFVNPLPMYYLNRLEESSIVIGMNQIENIYATISLMENKMSKKSRMDHLVKVNVAKCIYWCMQHNVSIHPVLAQQRGVQMSSYNPFYSA